MAKFYINLMFTVVLTFSSINFAHATSVSCTFDSDLCDWHIVGSGKFKWKRGSGLTEDRSSGPLNDHTCANYQGNYMLISGSDAESAKDIAVLESLPFSLSKETKFTFWYIMNGFGSGSLTLSTITDKSSTDVWKKEGRQGKDWIQDIVTLKPGKMRLQFKSSVRLPVGSDIAIDDIYLMSESQEDANKTHCQTTTTSTTTTTPSTTTLKTTIILPTTTTEELKTKIHKFSSLTTYGSSYPSSSSLSTCSKFAGLTKTMPGTCDFEKDTCGIKIIANDKNKGVTWQRTDKMDGNKFQYNSSIPGDHTFEINGTRGNYLEFRNTWSFFYEKRISSVETPAIYATFACITFWYIIPSNYSNLKVSVRDYTGRLTTLWEVDNYIQSKRAANLIGWHKQTLSVFEDPPFTVVFETYNNNYLAKVGLDDIKILGANVTTRMTRPVTDKTKPVISLTPGITRKSTQFTPDSTATKKLPNPGKQNTSSFTVTQTALSYIPSSKSTIDIAKTKQTSIQNEISTKNPHDMSTEKGNKKTTVRSTKKPPVIKDKESDLDKQSKNETEYHNSSTIVGGVVGALLVLIFIGVIVYAIIDNKDRHKRVRQTQEKIMEKSNPCPNGKVSNGGLNSEIHLNVHIANEKKESNGHEENVNETLPTVCLNPGYTNSQDNKQMNGNVNSNNHLPPLTSDITESPVKL